MKRLFDILSSMIALVLLTPFFLVVSILIATDSKGGVFYIQKRVGKDNKDFDLYKFRSMRPNDDQRKLTVGDRDPRVTPVGYFLRKYKLDELPQLINVLKGDMSIVGPRPEVRRYVDMYDEDQLKVLSVRPGLTDYASLEYVKESELLAQSSDPERTYIDEIMPAKLELNKKYINEKGMSTDLSLIFRTIARIVS